MSFKTCKRKIHEYPASERTCPECKRAYKKQWDSTQKLLGKYDAEKAIERATAWQRANKKRHSEHCRAWRINNPVKAAGYVKKRRAYIAIATPKWADLRAIREFYINCPEGYEVDHIIPLQGETVSGLHVLSNLQYLRPSENRIKGNKYEPVSE